MAKRTRFEQDMIDTVHEGLIIGEALVGDESLHAKAERLFDYLNDLGHFKGSPLPIYPEDSLAEKLQAGEAQDLLEIQDETGG